MKADHKAANIVGPHDRTTVNHMEALIIARAGHTTRKKNPDHITVLKSHTDGEDVADIN